MCPTCKHSSTSCTNWELKESCFYSKLSHLVDNKLTVVYSLFMAVWTVLLVTFWKRHQSRIQYQWDLIDFKQRFEPIRPQFERRVYKKNEKNKYTGVTKILIILIYVIGRLSNNFVFKDEEFQMPYLKMISIYVLSFSTVILMVYKTIK